MGISQRFLNRMKDSYRGAKLLFSNPATTPSRKPSTVGNGSGLVPNLIVDNSSPGITSLRLVDLRGQLFFDTTPPSSTFGEGPEWMQGRDITSDTQAADMDDLKKKMAEVAALNMEWFQLPAPIFSFRANGVPCGYGIDFFPLTDRKVVINHHSGHTFLFDADTRLAVTMPNLHRAKVMPISLFVPNKNSDDHLGSGGSLYIMERIPKPEVGGSALSDQFEALVYSKPSMTSTCQPADCRLLPPPPYICDPAYHYPYPKITAYAVVGSDIYISAEGFGTYCLDSLSNTWDRVGQWTLPFSGKVEYVPELKLWVGLSAEHGHLAAADLSDMNTEPHLVDTDSWKDFDPPEEWLVANNSQLVNLGSGRFCIARFFHTLLMEDDSVDEINQILVLTGVEVTLPVRNGNRSGNCTGKVKLTIKRHKSRCNMSDRHTALAVF